MPPLSPAGWRGEGEAVGEGTGGGSADVVVVEAGEEGVAVGGALGRGGADHVLEGDFLVGERVQDDLPNLGDVFGERQGGIDLDAQGQRVDEEADQACGIGVIAAGDQSADGQVATPGVAGEEDAEKGEQDDEVGGARRAVRVASSQATAAGSAVMTAWSPEKSVRSGAAWSGTGLVGVAPSRVSLHQATSSAAVAAVSSRCQLA